MKNLLSEGTLKFVNREENCVGHPTHDFGPGEGLDSFSPPEGLDSPRPGGLDSPHPGGLDSPPPCLS